MATGDNLETGIAVAKQCEILGEDYQVIDSAQEFVALNDDKVELCIKGDLLESLLTRRLDLNDTQFNKRMTQIRVTARMSPF